MHPSSALPAGYPTESMHSYEDDHTDGRSMEFVEAVMRRPRSARPASNVGIAAHGQRLPFPKHAFFEATQDDDDDDEEYIVRGSNQRRRSSSGRSAPLPKQHSMPVRDEAGRFTGVRLKTAEERARREGGGVFKTAAIEVLRQEMRLMSTGDITRVALNRGLLGQTGKTPEATMASALYTDVKRKEGCSAFIRPVEGMFGLREWADMAFDKQYRVIVGGNAPRVHSKQQEEYDDDEFRLPAIRQTSSMANGGHQQLPLMPMPIRRPRVHRAAGPAHPYNSSAGGPMTLPRAASDPYGHARPMRRPTRPAAYDDDDDDDVDGGVYDAREDVVYEYAYAAPRVGTKRSSYEMRGGDGVPHHPARQGWTGSWNTSKQMPAESSASQASREGGSFMLLLSAIDELAHRSGDDSATVMQQVAEARPPRGAYDEVSSPAPKKQALGEGVVREEAAAPTSNESSTSQVGLFASMPSSNRSLNEISQRFLLRAQQAAQMAAPPALNQTLPHNLYS